MEGRRRSRKRRSSGHNDTVNNAVLRNEDSRSSTTRKTGKIELVPIYPSTTEPFKFLAERKIAKKEMSEEEMIRYSKNFAPFKDSKFFSEPHYEMYTKMCLSDRRRFVRRRVENKSHNEAEHLRKELTNFLVKIQNDPLLNKFWKYDVSGTALNDHLLQMSATRSQMRNKKKCKSVNMKQEVLPSLEMFAQNQPYVPPTNRVLLMHNITFNKEDRIPVFSDLEGDPKYNLKLPNSFFYDYNDVNRLNARSEIDLAKAVEKAQQKENMIKCSCCSSEKIVPCFLNKKCPCYITNKKLQTLQSQGNPEDNSQITKFSTFERIVFYSASDSFFKYVGFACSEECGCKGQCTNNSIFLAEKKIFPLEVFRSDPDIGFSVRCSVMIPAGTPIMEFVGDLVEEELLDPSASDYAYQVAYPKERALLDVINEMPWTDDYKALLKRISNRKYYLNPKLHGNIGRTVCHSCTANAEVVRVYQKSISPAHLHLMIVSLVDIYPGIPITFDYGKSYVAEQLQHKCKCGSFACRDGPHHKEYSKFNMKQWTESFKRLDEVERKKWELLISTVRIDKSPLKSCNRRKSKTSGS